MIHQAQPVRIMFFHYPVQQGASASPQEGDANDDANARRELHGSE